MIFSHIQKPLGMRKTRVGKRIYVQGVPLDTTLFCPYCCATVDTTFVTSRFPEGEMPTCARLTWIIHERFVEIRAAHRKTDEYTEKAADSLHYRLEAPKIEFPLFINKTQLRE